MAVVAKTYKAAGRNRLKRESNENRSDGSRMAERRQIDAEMERLSTDARREKNWKRWGPYLAERQWGTVREDYSPDGSLSGPSFRPFSWTILPRSLPNPEVEALHEHGFGIPVVGRPLEGLASGLVPGLLIPGLCPSTP